MMDASKVVRALDAEIAVAKLRDTLGHDRRFWAGYAEGLGFGREILAPSDLERTPDMACGEQRLCDHCDSTDGQCR